MIRIMKTLTPARYIRLHVFGIETQTEFARLLGYEQPQMSRFENGAPFSSEAQSRIRRLATERGIDWDNNWFFEVPENKAPERAA